MNALHNWLCANFAPAMACVSAGALVMLLILSVCYVAKGEPLNKDNSK